MVAVTISLLVHSLTAPLGIRRFERNVPMESARRT